MKETLDKLKTSRRGLEQVEVAGRLEQFGRNQLTVKRKIENNSKKL